MLQRKVNKMSVKKWNQNQIDLLEKEKEDSKKTTVSFKWHEEQLNLLKSNYDTDRTEILDYYNKIKDDLFEDIEKEKALNIKTRKEIKKLSEESENWQNIAVNALDLL